MTIAIHQPNFIPWIGYFYKIKHCDLFVLLDDVQYTKNSYINRNKIKTFSGEQWVTMPVLHTGVFGQSINEVHLMQFNKYYAKFLRTLKTSYSKAPFFDVVMSILSVDSISGDLLSDLNETLIRRISSFLEIQTPIKKSSELADVGGLSTNRLISICRQYNADRYLAGIGSKKYQDDALFHQAGITPIVSNFSYPVYKQLYGPFIPNLSVVDVLMNNGKDSILFI